MGYLISYIWKRPLHRWGIEFVSKERESKSIAVLRCIKRISCEPIRHTIYLLQDLI